MDDRTAIIKLIKQLRTNVSRLPPFEVATKKLKELGIQVFDFDLTKNNPTLTCSPWAEDAFERAYAQAPD